MEAPPRSAAPFTVSKHNIFGVLHAGKKYSKNSSLTQTKHDSTATLVANYLSHFPKSLNSKTALIWSNIHIYSKITLNMKCLRRLGDLKGAEKKYDL